MAGVVTWLLAVAGATSAVAQGKAYTDADYTTALWNFYFGVRQYNLVTFGDFGRVGGASGQDTEGAIAIGGNFTSGNIDLVNKSEFVPKNTIRSSATDPSVLIRGRVDALGTIKVNNGYAAFNSSNNTRYEWTTEGRYREKANTSHEFLFNGIKQDPTSNWPNTIPAGWSFESLKTSMLSAQEVLASHTANFGITTTGGTIATTAAGLGKVTYWNPTTAELNSYSSLEFKVDASSLLVINLNVTDGASFPSLNINNSEASQSRILWNIVMPPTSDPSYASTFTFNSGGGYVFGAVLAPNANIIANRVIQGQVIAGSFSLGNNELHMAYFDNQIIPEPSTCAAIAGCLALGFAVWRKRRGTAAGVAA